MFPFRRWHPQLALRYLPIVGYIKKSGIKNPTILEVGSGSLGIGPYLKKPFTGVDIDFTGPKWPQMKQVKGKAEDLPFPNNSFDIVLSVDVLEHLPPKHRPLAINELLRVATKSVIIAVPCGDKSQAQDRDLSLDYTKKFHQPFPFLQEHLKYSLPSQKELMTWINAAAKKYHKKIIITQQGNRNLQLRRWLMCGWMTKNFFVDLFFRKILLLFLPLLWLLDQHPLYYRQIFFIKIHRSA